MSVSVSWNATFIELAPPFSGNLCCTGSIYCIDLFCNSLYTTNQQHITCVLNAAQQWVLIARYLGLRRSEHHLTTLHQMLSPTSTGRIYELASASSSNWRSSCVGLHLSIYRISCSTCMPLCRRDVEVEVACTRSLAVILDFRRRDMTLSAIVHFLQPAMDPWILAPRGP